MTDGQLSEAKQLEIIRAILAEPVPRWFQNAPVARTPMPSSCAESLR
ncbi:MAG: hypothetical protein ABI808_07560 [Pseudonocardiales bacterium]